MMAAPVPIFQGFGGIPCSIIALVTRVSVAPTEDTTSPKVGPRLPASSEPAHAAAKSPTRPPRRRNRPENQHIPTCGQYTSLALDSLLRWPSSSHGPSPPPPRLRMPPPGRRPAASPRAPPRPTSPSPSRRLTRRLLRRAPSSRGTGALASRAQRAPLPSRRTVWKGYPRSGAARFPCDAPEGAARRALRTQYVLSFSSGGLDVSAENGTMFRAFALAS